MKHLYLEVMAAYATRRDGVMKRHQAGMLTKEEANAKIDGKRLSGETFN